MEKCMELSENRWSGSAPRDQNCIRDLSDVLDDSNT